MLWILLVAACGRIGFHETDGGVDAAPGAISASRLSVDWTTPDRTMWRWEWAGDPTLLDHFELVTGPTEDDVRFRSAATTTIGPAQRPELGYPALPDTLTDRVDHTLIDSEPDTTTFAALVAIDRSGGESSTEIIAVTSQADPTVTYVLYSNSFVPGSYAIPPEFVEATDRPAAGSTGLRFDSTCPGGDCFENLRHQGLAVSFAIPVAQGAFPTAYLEMHVATERAPSYWSQVRICVQDCDTGHRYKYDWITLAPDQGYSPIQVPLRMMTSETDGSPLTAAELSMPIFEWGIGGSWAQGSTTRVDEVRIRY